MVIQHGSKALRFVSAREKISLFLKKAQAIRNKIEVVDIPTGYTHNIENLGDTDMVTFMWCNECFDPGHPETYFDKV